MSVRVSPVSRAAAVLIVVVGLFTFFVSYPTGVLLGEVMGIAFIVLGLVLYGMLYRFRTWVEREVRRAEQSAPSTAVHLVHFPG